MDEKMKAELDGLLNNDRDRAAARQRAIQQQLEIEASSVDRFKQLCDDVLMPAVRELADRVKAGGWHYALNFRGEARNSQGGLSDSRLELILARSADGVHQGGHQKTAFSVIFNRTSGNVTFYESAAGSAGPAGNVKLEGLSAQAIQARLMAFFKKMLGERPS